VSGVPSWLASFTVNEVDDTTRWERLVEHFGSRLIVAIPLGGFLAVRFYLDAQRGVLSDGLPVILAVALTFVVVARLVSGGRKGEAKARLWRAHGRRGVVFSINKTNRGLGYDYLWLDETELWLIDDDGARTSVGFDEVVLLRGRSSGKILKLRLGSPAERFVKVYLFGDTAQPPVERLSQWWRAR